MSAGEATRDGECREGGSGALGGWRACVRVLIVVRTTSSRAGAMTSPTGPSPSPRAGWSRMWRTMGSRNARVLPEPVLATPMMSLPDMSAGMAMAYVKGKRMEKRQWRW
jgi:hypothetical protein